MRMIQFNNQASPSTYYARLFVGNGNSRVAVLALQERLAQRCCEDDKNVFEEKDDLLKGGWTCSEDLTMKHETIPVTTAVWRSK